ncbi:hypothetical protein MACJ_002796 [Theileria orientalis]|uniref:Uncharacterized protein n=1 Tax=Theileria orientalis TaxID=68886 RepID=A0A976QRL9_THEOR|nr:hypothetical protein MACJ_002796 [Theileria orientalis]
MSLVSHNLANPPAVYKNSTVLFSYHVKKVTLKPWVTKYLDSVPLKLKWELESPEGHLVLEPQLPTLITKWESDSFKLEGTQASNVDTIFLLAQTIRDRDSLVLNGTNLKVSLVIDNSTNVVVGTCTCSLETFKVRSRFNPHSFELMNESKMFIGYVDIFYVSQQRWVRINKGSLPMINKKETEYNSSPESNVNTSSVSERRTEDGTTLSCSSYGDTESPFSANSPREDYVLIFWNSTNTCFVKNNPNDVQLQLLFMFIKTCLIDGDSPNSTIPFELGDIRPDEPFEVLKKFSSSMKQLSYKDAKHFMHIPHSQRTSSNKSSSENNIFTLEDDEKMSTTDESNFEIQHSSRLYTESVPSTQRLMSDVDVNDPASFYNFISKQNKHFQTLLSKRFLSPTSSLNTTTSSISNKFSSQGTKKTRYLSQSQSFDDDSTRYNSLPTYSKSIETVASYVDITQKTTNTMTTGLVSYRNEGTATVDEESLTIGDATATTTNTFNTNRTFQEKYNQSTTKTNLYDIDENAVNMYTKDRDLPTSGDVSMTNIAEDENPQENSDAVDKLDKVKTVQQAEAPEASDDSEHEKAESSGGSSYVTKKSNSSFVTPTKSSITVYSIYSPRDYMEGLSAASESADSDLGSESASRTSESPSNTKTGFYDKYFFGEDKKPDGHLKYAYYSSDSESDPVGMLSGYRPTEDLQVNRALHCERSLLNFDTISKDLQTIGELKSTTDPELGSFDSTLIFKALQDAQILRVQGQTLPTSAYLKFFLRYLRCYNQKRVPIVVYLQIITFKQLDTMKRISSSSSEILRFINIALEALIYELQVSTSMNVGASEGARGLLFQRSASFNNKAESDEETDLFMFDSDNDRVDFGEFETNSAFSGDEYVVFQNILAKISEEAHTLNTRSLVYVSRLNSPPVKNRGCIFKINALKIVFYRTFCGRRKLLSNGHTLKL